MPALPILPARPEAAFHPTTYRARSGRYAGALDEVRWGYRRGWLYGQVRRAWVRTRWFDVVVHGEAHVLRVRLQDDGLSGHGRVALLDRVRGVRQVWACAPGAPLRTLVVGFMAAEGTDAFLRSPALEIGLRRPEGASAWALSVQGAGLDVQAQLDEGGGATPSLVVGEGRAPWSHRPGLTQYHPGLRVAGSGTWQGRALWEQAPTAHLTYTNVFPAPGVGLRRVVADGRAPDGTPVAVALADGDLHGETQEATLWWGGVPHALPDVALRRERGAEAERWTARGAEGVQGALAVVGRTGAARPGAWGRAGQTWDEVHGDLDLTVPHPATGERVDLAGLRAAGTAWRLTP